MPKGGARNRSGPPPDPKSGASERRGFTLTALPSEGYSGQAPTFPLMPYEVQRWETEDKRRYQVLDGAATAVFQEREAELWAWAWTFPQACAWSLEPWRWHTVAMWVRTHVLCETSDATAADKGSVHRFADQIGLTPAGLKENGWAIAKDEVAAKATARSAAAPPPEAAAPAPARRMRAVASGG